MPRMVAMINGECRPQGEEEEERETTRMLGWDDGWDKTWFMVACILVEVEFVSEKMMKESLSLVQFF